MKLLVLLWLIAVTSPHILYIFAYHYGPSLNKLIPHHEFVNLAIILRGSTIAITYWLLYESEFQTSEFFQWFSVSPFQWIGIGLILYGIHLNTVVYNKLGSGGVYYSCEMINQCKTISGYPYNRIQHPMYIASILILLGSVCALGIDSEYRPKMNIIIPLVYMISLYFISIYVESQPPNEKMTLHFE